MPKFLNMCFRCAKVRGCMPIVLTRMGMLKFKNFFSFSLNMGCLLRTAMVPACKASADVYTLVVACCVNSDINHLLCLQAPTLAFLAPCP